MIKLLVCNKDLVETEYLRREYNLVSHLVDPNRISESDALTYIACTEPSNWEQFLRSANPSSVVFFLLGNETYDKKKYELLNEFKSIRHVFLYNPPRNSSSLGLLALLGWILRVPSDLKSKHLFFAWKFAYQMKKNAKSARIRYSWSNLPLGYTNRFVMQLPDELVNSSMSLIDNWPFVKFGESQGHKNQIKFMGQIGTWYRKELLKYFSRFSDFEYVESSGWGLSSKNGYVETLQSSTFILCPPGIYTNETFRYYESIICGALPIAPVNTLHDFHSSVYWSQILPFYVKHSHIEMYRFLRKLPANRIAKYQLYSRNLVASEIQAVRVKLQSIQYEKI
jgi:hypothetical protein